MANYIFQLFRQALVTQKPTKTVDGWTDIVDAIYEDLRYTGKDDNAIDAMAQLLKVQNDADIAILFKKFAKRQETHFGVQAGPVMNLWQFVINNFSNGDIVKLNANYRGKGMQFQF